MTQSTGGSNGGYQVDPNELTNFATYLSGTTAPAVSKAGDDVKSANGFDNDAFGILLGQIFSAPVRIDMAVVHDKIMGDLTNSVNAFVDGLKKNADQYTQQESATAGNFQNMQGDTNFAGNKGGTTS